MGSEMCIRDSTVIEPDNNVDAGEGTNGILRQSPGGGAEQSIAVDFGREGEIGHRVGIVFDAGNNGNQEIEGLVLVEGPAPLVPLEAITDPVETPNLFLPSTEASEQFVIDGLPNDPFADPNVVSDLQLSDAPGPQSVIFNKEDPFTLDAVIDHQFDPSVFSTVVVRNDQNINLFAGNLQTVDNSLNENITTVEAQFGQFGANTRDLVGGIDNLVGGIDINPIELQEANAIVLNGVPLPAATQVQFSAPIELQSGENLFFVLVNVSADDLETVGDELQLRDPSDVLADDPDSDPEKIDDDIRSNEVEKIIREIEESPDAEAGYWYKVFSDSGDEKELLFYHLKTGELPETDQSDEAGDDSDAGIDDPFDLDSEVQIVPAPTANDAPAADDAPAIQAPPFSVPGTFEPASEPPVENLELPTLELTPPNQGQFGSDGVGSVSASFGLTAGSLLLASMAIQQNKNGVETTNVTDALASNDATNTCKQYGKAARLKRKLARQLGLPSQQR